MTQKEGNFLIANFEGFTYPSIKNKVWKISEPNLHNYHEDWNKIMRVVAKIESLGYCVSIFRGCCDIEERELYQEGWDEIANGGGQPKIISAWKSVTQFIQWYNTQKQNP